MNYRKLTDKALPKEAEKKKEEEEEGKEGAKEEGKEGGEEEAAKPAAPVLDDELLGLGKSHSFMKKTRIVFSMQRPSGNFFKKTKQNRKTLITEHPVVYMKAKGEISSLGIITGIQIC